jgi:hypothetical protein
MAQKLVPVTEEDKKKSYYKYYLAELVDAPPEHYQKVLAGPIDPAKALPVQDRNRLFEPGYFEEEVGYCVMPDGTGYVYNLLKMPGVTAEMLPVGVAIPEFPLRALNLHNIKEFTNLAALLPKIFPEERDNF